MRQFIEGLAVGSLVADVGCGNGKYFMVRQDIAVLGSDRSTGLAQVAATRLAAGTGASSGLPHSRAPSLLQSNFLRPACAESSRASCSAESCGRQDRLSSACSLFVRTVMCCHFHCIANTCSTKASLYVC